MEAIVNQIHKLLIKSNSTISAAESCTGGILASLLTQYSGSSQYFVLGLITYSNAAKTGVLKISKALIERKGAVSQEVARAMAKGVRRLAKTDFALSTTGIAGPTGGSMQKPVGTVFIAIASKNKLICKKFHFKGSRSAIRKSAALKSLELLKTIL